MKKRVFEIIYSVGPSSEIIDIVKSKTGSSHFTVFVSDKKEYFDKIQEDNFKSFLLKNEESFVPTLDKVVHFLNETFELVPLDVIVVSDQNHYFVCEFEKWDIELTSNPIVLAMNENDYYERGPIIFTYSQYLRRKHLLEWIFSESKKINSNNFGLLRAQSKKPKTISKIKIYDCFVFNNEFDILSLRLKLLNEKVEKFILVESKQTHSGISKPAFFEQNKELFEEYSDKIVNIVIDKFPDRMIYQPSETDVPEHLHIHWFRENYQRNEILKGLYKIGLNPDDVVLISDLDEIPDPSKLDEFIKMIPEDDYAFQLQKWCIWDFDRFYNGLWPGTGGVKWKTLCKSTPQEIRKNRYSENKLHTNEPFGWHCSWFGGIDVVMDKLRSFAHQELREMSKEDVETKMTMNLDIHGHQLIYDKEDYRPLI